MKKLRKTHQAKSYKELCELLNIEPAKRGAEKQAQIKEIKKTHCLVKHRNGSFTISPKASEEKPKEEGQVAIIDGTEVDLKNTKNFANTGIYDYIDYKLITNADYRQTRKDTKQALVTECFCRSKLFKELLDKNNYELLKKYNKIALEAVNKYAISRLSALVDSEIKKLEKSGLIVQDSYYIDKDKCRINIAEDKQKELEQKALSDVHCVTSYQACSHPSTKQRFINARNKYIQEETGITPIAKKFHVNFSDSIKEEDYDRYKDNFYIGAQESQIILTKFFNVFRAKLCFDLKRKNAKGEYVEKITGFDSNLEAIKIIEEYCAYMTTPSLSSFEAPVAFYNLNDILAWQEEKNKAWSDEYNDTLYCSSDQQNIYNIKNFLDEYDYPTEDEYIDMQF